MIYKKIISLILACSLALSFGWLVQAEDDDAAIPPENIISGEYTLLEKLGIIESFFAGDKIPTRAEFMKYLALSAGYGDIAEKTYNGKFYDVNTSTAYYQYIQTMENLKIVNGSGGAFNPSAGILERDAIVTAVKLTGYDIYAEAEGGYPTGYYYAANRAGLTKGLALGSSEYLKGENVLRLLFNLIKTKLILRQSYGDNSKIGIEKGDTLLESVFSVYEGKGVVSANGHTGLQDSKDSCAEGFVVIDNVSYYAPVMDTGEELGAKLDFYYIEEDNEREIIFYMRDYDNKSRFVLRKSKVTDEVNNFIYTYEEGNKKEELKFSGSSDIIFNGKAYPQYQADDLKPLVGNVTFIDNDYDGIYEIIKVKSYREYIVSGVSAEQNKIEFKDASPVRLDDAEDKVIIKRNGEEISIEEIFENDIAAIASSADGNYIEINISSVYTEGEVGEISEEDGLTYISIGENRYPLSPLSEYSPELRDGGTFYIDCFGYIFAKDIAVTNETYGYLMKVGSTGVYDKTYYFKILTPTGVITYEGAEKAALNGNNYIDIEKVVNDEALKANGAENENSEKTFQQLIKFKTDGQGKLNFIRTFTDNRESFKTATKTRDDNRFTYDYTDGGAGLYYRGGNGRIMGTRFLMNAKTKVFTVPEEYSEDEDKFKAYSLTYLQNDLQYKNMEMYDVAYNYVTGVLVLRSASGVANKIDNSSNALIIKKITECFDAENGGRGYKISGFRNGMEREYYVYDEDLADNDERYGNGITVKELKTGDVIQIAEEDGIIDEMRVIFRYTPGFGYGESASAGINYMHMGLYYGTGKVITRDSSVIITNCHNIDDRAWDRSYFITNYSHFVKVDTSTDKVTLISAYDLDEGDMVFVRSCYSTLYDVVVYK